MTLLNKYKEFENSRVKQAVLRKKVSNKVFEKK